MSPPYIDYAYDNLKFKNGLQGRKLWQREPSQSIKFAGYFNIQEGTGVNDSLFLFLSTGITCLTPAIIMPYKHKVWAQLN